MEKDEHKSYPKREKPNVASTKIVYICYFSSWKIIGISNLTYSIEKTMKEYRRTNNYIKILTNYLADSGGLYVLGIAKNS